ncbi:MAG TPA: type II secretion system protein GspG [Myxococcota bacterium]|jgi:general secretion pathway protein G|nr:type II secretion system protein GspG [Myxococcota bacterium]
METQKGLGTAARGMTLVEILVVITILGLIAGAVAIAVLPQLGKAKVKTAEQDMKTMESAIEVYISDSGNCPPSLNDLIATGNLKKHSLSDPWGTPYNYACPGEKNSTGWDLWSVGPDKKPNTEDDVWPK